MAEAGEVASQEGSRGRAGPQDLTLLQTPGEVTAAGERTQNVVHAFRKIDQIDKDYRSTKQGTDQPDLEHLVSRIVQNFIAPTKVPAETRPQDEAPSPLKTSSTVGPPMRLLTEEVVKKTFRAGGTEIIVTPKTIITPLALDFIKENNLKIVSQEKSK